MTDELFRIARRVTDDVLGPGAYADVNRGNPDPRVREQVQMSDEHRDKPFTLDLEERDAVRHILAEVERRGYDDTTLHPVVASLYQRLRDRWHEDREAQVG